METNAINSIGGRYEYLEPKKALSSEKNVARYSKAADSVSLSSDFSSLSTNALSLANRQVYESLIQTNLSTNQNNLVEINKRLIEKSNPVASDASSIETLDNNYFSPQNTAERIYNFATSFYESYLMSSGKADSEESRQEYRNIIDKAIDDGFSQALSILGDLPGKVSQEIQSTRDIITTKLDGFVKGEEATYHQKVVDMISTRVNELDEDKSGDLTLKETNLSKDFFNEMDQDKDGKLSIEELVAEYKKNDYTKDLSNDLLNSIINKSQSYSEIAKLASKGINGTKLTFDFYAKNPQVAQAIIRFAGNDNYSSLSAYLDKHPEAVRKIMEDPSKIAEIVRQYKLDSIVQNLGDNPITEDFLTQHESEVENLFDNPKLLDFFKNDTAAAARLVDALTSKE